MPDEKPLTTGQVAAYCRVNHLTALKWLKDGDLKAYRTPGGHYRILKSDLREFLERQGIPVDEAFLDEVGRDHKAISDEKPLTTSQVAAYCHVTRMTTLKWIKDEDLKAHQIPSGRYRILKSDLREFLEHQGMPVDEAFLGKGGKDRTAIPDEKPLTISQVAAYCHVSHTTALRWIKDGNLKAYRIPGGHYRILRSALREFLEHQGMPVDEAFFGEALGEKDRR